MQIGLGIGIPFTKSQVWLAVQAVFTPAKLFESGANGLWLDPSDLTAMFQDSAGTTPVTAVEQPVGLVLDKRDTVYSTYFDGAGDYLGTPDSTSLNLSSGAFTIECWVYPQRNNIKVLNKGGVNGTSYPDYELSINGSGYIAFGIGGSLGSYAVYTGVTSIPLNTWTHIAIVRSGNTIKSYVSGLVDINGTYSLTAVNSTRDLNIGRQPNDPIAQNWLGNISNVRIVKDTALYIANFTPPTAPLQPVAGTSLLTCGTSWSGNPAITRFGDTRADKLNPFGTGTGNHAFQSTSANRPTLSARYNMLTKTEQFDDAYWTKIGVTSLSSSIIQEANPTGVHAVNRAFTYAAGAWTLVAKVKARTGTRNIALRMWNGTVTCGAIFNPSTGAFVGNGSDPAPTSYTQNDLGGGIWEFSITTTFTAGTGDVSLNLANGTTLSYAADASNSIELLGASLVQANQASLPYQRVNAATDYDSDATKFPWYLKFNGTSSSLQTASINFTATDKMFVAAGVRKLSDAAAGLITELSSAIGSNAGSFYIFAGDAGGGGTPKYATGSRGTTISSTTTTGNYAAPITNVLSGKYSISEDMSILRVNSIQDINNTSDQGTGNYGNYPLYIGARAGTSLFFNGNLYQLVIAGKQASAEEIDSTENYIELKTFGKDMSYVYDYLVDSTGNQITDSAGNPIYVTATYQ